MTDELTTVLAREHAEWLNEVRAAIGTAEASGGPWARWQALRYFERDFPARVAHERRLVDALGPRLSEAHRAQLWALGELLDVWPSYLSHLVGLCHRGREFAAVTGRMTAALERWCSTLEQALAVLPATALPPAAREEFALPATASAACACALG
jgi:hypothetical protein